MSHHTIAESIVKKCGTDAGRVCNEASKAEGVSINQDWSREITTYRFTDGSFLDVSGPDVLADQLLGTSDTPKWRAVFGAP